MTAQKNAIRGRIASAQASLALVAVCVFAWTNLVIASTGPAGYVVKGLGTLEGGVRSYAAGINNIGQVVGHASLGDGSQRAFVWSSAGGMEDLGSLYGSRFSYANAINDRGEIVGRSSDRAFLCTCSEDMQDLGTFWGGQYSAANAINNQGIVVGYSQGMDDEDSYYLHAFSYTAAGGMWDLGTGFIIPFTSGLYGNAMAVNDQGQIVINWDNGMLIPWEQPILGTTVTGPGGEFYPYLPGAGYSTQGSDVNNNGQVIGVSGHRGFLYTIGGAIQDLGTFAPVAINDDGQIVGNGSLYTAAQGVQNLNGLIFTPGWEIFSATDINNTGQIVGYGQYLSGQDQALILTPVTPGSGDATGDGKVDFADFQLLLDHWMLEGWWGTGDFTGDGGVDFLDFQVMLDYWNPTGSSAATPEPTALFLLSIGAATLLRKKNARRGASNW